MKAGNLEPNPDPVRLATPLSNEEVENLTAGQRVLLSGVVYTARDAAHARLVEMLRRSEPLPFDISGQVIYYAGPTPARPGRVIGSVGPTTSGRMDVFTTELLAVGLKGMIGKGERSREVVDAIVRHKAVYFAATGGAGALLSKRVVACEVIAFEDLGCEAIHRLEVVDFPLIVINDCRGRDFYVEARSRKFS
ncbi:MAG: Fe-S-containing hydro-lyase [Armatimonadetes bacterium]|nr:Fe-S-containing hydro-lyase [Armatimonadota bacterium]